MKAALICVCLLAMAGCASVSKKQDVPVVPPAEPQFKAERDARWDRDCAAERNQIIKPEWETEFDARLPELQRLWESQAPAFVREVARLTGKKFEPEKTVRFTLCDEFSNAYGGITVNIRFALRSVVAEPVPLQYKIDVGMHEMLHPFIAKLSLRDTPLLRAIPGETRCVRNHVHLFALQKAALLEVGARERLAQVVAIDSKLTSNCYPRAWAIVNQSEDHYKGYVREIAAAK